jgi:glycosyltransferase involved in cell wall biosynthesis
MRITWITRSFLDYRVSVFDNLNKLVGGNLTLIFYKDVVPLRVRRKTEQVLGQNSIGLNGELRLIGPKSFRNGASGAGLRIPLQPGLVRAVRSSTPDIMITDGFFQWTTAALWLRATKGIPHVMLYERTHHTERNAQWYRKFYRKLVMRWIDAICCNGWLCGEYTRNLGFPENRITYGHMVADVEGLKQAVSHVSRAEIDGLRDKYGLHGMVFLYVGGLVQRKGIYELLKAWKEFTSRRQSQAMTLLLVGDGPQREQLEQYCESNRLGNVCFAGAIDYDKLAPFYKSADVFVIPTLSDNWSLVVPEAMACGLPILCSKYNGCWPELVTPSNGWVFDPHDVADIVTTLEECIQASEKLPEMGRKSLKIVANYTGRTAAEAILRTCELAINNKLPN